jgi:hypothetical protein
MLRSLFTSRVLLSGLLLGILLFVGVLLLLWFTRPETPTTPPAAVILNVTPAPTGTQALPTPSTMPIATDTPGSTGALSINQYVQVTGTGGDGLRLRAAPGLNGEIKMLGSEGEIYRVQDGPQQADGYTWWLLVDPDDETRQGWAVADFLQPTQYP